MFRTQSADNEWCKGLENELTVTVSKYESAAVCETYPQGIISPTACESLLQEMPNWNARTEYVGPRDRPSLNRYTRLPKTYVHGECNFKSGSELAIWFRRSVIALLEADRLDLRCQRLPLDQCARSSSLGFRLLDPPLRDGSISGRREWIL